MNPLKQLAGQTAIYGLPTIVGRLLNYFLVPLYTYMLPTHEYGIVTELYAYVAFIFVILTYGMETAFFRFAQTEENKSRVYNTAVSSLIVTTTFFVLITLLFSGNIAVWMEYGNHSEYIRWFVLILAFDALSAIPFARLREQNKAMRFALIKSINISINIAFNLFFILLCPLLYNELGEGWARTALGYIYRPDNMVSYIFISNLIASSITLLMLLPEIKSVHFCIEKDLWRKMLKYALPLMIFGMAGIVNETFDRILLKHLLPDTVNKMSELGIYGACYKLSILMTLFIQTFRYAAEPFFFSHSKNTDARGLYAKVMLYFVIVCSLIFLLVMLYIDIALYFVGKDYRVGAPVVPILLVANLFLGVFYNLSIWYKLTGQTLYGAYLAIFGAIVTLVANFLLVPRFGYMGAAWGHFICYGSMMVLSYYFGQKYFTVNYNLPKILGYLGMAVGFYFLSRLFGNLALSVKLIVNTLFLIIYVVSIVYIEKPQFIFNRFK
ncbi:MAG: oligosaccharide flippase family protein [Lentimicrobiaceae bacterium]|nr:oligosaccharide flippase family protein [Lentimicrobiaceae bacterium]